MSPTTADIYRNEQTNVINDKFWSDDPSILFNSARAIEFVPTADMNSVERLNAISRFFIYLSLVLFVISRNYMTFWIGILAMVVIYVIFRGDSSLKAVNVEAFDRQIKDAFGVNHNVPIRISDTGELTQRPTPHNPFMNVLLSDYVDNPQRFPASRHSDQDVKDEVEKYFGYNLYQDVSDVFQTRNQRREFYTVPSAQIPNDRESLMKWCWGSEMVSTCKDGDQEKCLQFEDLRVPGYS
jgi:hypothetical protein